MQTWRFQLDRENIGIEECWFESTLSQSIALPGSLPAQGIGDEVTVDTPWIGSIFDPSYFTATEYEKYRQPGNIKVPFWLQPDKYYAGVAWYQCDIEIPEQWQELRVVLNMERPHWQTRVWLDDREIGSNDSLSTPHEYDLGTNLSPGKYQLTIRIDNSLLIDIGVNSHSITDHTQGNWNGIVGSIDLIATEPVWIDDLQVFPNVENRSVAVKGQVRSGEILPQRSNVTLSAELFNVEQPARVAPMVANVGSDGVFEAEYSLGGDAQLWDEFNPALYRLTAALDNGESKSVIFGLRELGTQGTQFVLNGRKIFFRGTLECAIFPGTGHPPTDVESWKRIIRICKAHGLNHMRFHSWCPPEAAFVAADELGFYYQIEAASWANQSTTLGDGKPVDAWIYAETDRILNYYGNHPCFLLMAYGNEPGGDHHREYLAEWVNHFKAHDPRRLYTGGSAWPQIAENQFHVTSDPRAHQWGDGLKSRLNARPPETCTDYGEYISRRNMPVISHEIGQWCVYPNFAEMPKYTGYLKPKNFEIFRERLDEHHLSDQAHQFLLASGKLQTLCYKEEIESALRTAGMGGFQLLDLHDFPGQGTALVGVLDAFWDEKGYVTAEQYSRFCNSTVLLARLDKRVFTTDEKLEADIEVAHFGAAPLENVTTTWELVADTGQVVMGGQLPARTIPVDNGIPPGSVSIELNEVPAPARYKLVVSLAGTPFKNDWDVWVYPLQVETQIPPDVTVVQQLHDEALATLDAGGKILWLIPPDQVKGDENGQVALGFSSIFWNTAWTNGQAPHTLGILCDPQHPALARFPTDFHSDWQWWYLINHAGAMILDDLPSSLRPTVQVIDDWFTNRKLGLIVEGKVGNGKLLICSIDLDSDNPVSRQMLHSLLTYIGSEKFSPTTALAVEQVRGLCASQ